MPPPRAATGHEWVDHVGEMRLHVTAATLAGLATEAARALAELQGAGGARGPVGEWWAVRVVAADPVALLVNWLNELIYRAESRSEVITEVEVTEATPTRLVARLRGIPVGQPPALVKAATLHDARVAPCEGGWHANLTVDI
jgi:SHS2 domain-containing protein